MDKVKYIILLLFVGFNALVAVSLLLKACASYFGAWWPSTSGAPATKAKPHSRAWTRAVRRQQPQAHAAQPMQAVASRC